jgi:hypothetical protein
VVASILDTGAISNELCLKDIDDIWQVGWCSFEDEKPWKTHGDQVSPNSKPPFVMCSESLQPSTSWLKCSDLVASHQKLWLGHSDPSCHHDTRGLVNQKRELTSVRQTVDRQLSGD